MKNSHNTLNINETIVIFYGNQIAVPKRISVVNTFNILLQFYGDKPADEIIRQRGTGKFYGRKSAEIYLFEL